MGAGHSREDRDLSDSESESESRETTAHESESEDTYGTPSSYLSDQKRDPKTPSSLGDVESRLKALKIKYSSVGNDLNHKNVVKLYLHIGGHTAKSKWVMSEKLASYSFSKTDAAGEEDEDDEEGYEQAHFWGLRIGSKVRAKVDENLQLKASKEQKRVDIVANGVWAVKFFTSEVYDDFTKRYQECLFENTYGYEANDENKLKVYGKDFMGWANPEVADDSMWEDVEENLGMTPRVKTNVGHDLSEEFEEAAATGGAIQSLTLGALDNSFLVGDSGIQVVRNYNHGIQGKGIYVNFNDSRLSMTNGGSSTNYLTPRKTLLMKAETNMLLMSPVMDGKPHNTGLHQLDIETGRVVSEWRFEKDGTDITMRDITNDSKGAQMDPSGATFLGLDDNRLCRWDMRDRKGIVQNIVNESTPVLNWTQGHQFARGTNFQCFATTGDGSIVVGSLDGKIRLYSTSSMRQAKTAFPGLGSPITHVDVTYDGKWILGTTDTYLILICSLFSDKDGKVKSGFAGRMGNRISAPRLLKLNPLDSHLAGANNNFRNAQFSWVTENGKQERHLVATVGKFSVIWNFQQVKDGFHKCYQNQVGLKSCYCYKVVPKNESIVDSRFMHEKFAVSDSPEAPLVVATPMKLNKTVSGPTGVGGDWGSRGSLSASEWTQEGDFSWSDRQALDTDTGHGTKNWSSQPYSSAHLMESNYLLRTSSHPEHQQQHRHQQQNQHDHFSSEPILIPKSTFTSYPPPGRLQQDSPNGQSLHSKIVYQPSGLQIPISSSNILPLPNPQLQLNTSTHVSQYGGNLPQMPHGRPQHQWMNQNSPFLGDRSGLPPNNVLPQPLSNQNGLVPPQIMSHQRSMQTRMHHPFQPAFSQLSGLQHQLFNPHLSVSPPVMNSFEILGSPDLRDQRVMPIMRSRPGMRYPPQGYDTSGQKVESGWPRFKAKYMSTDEIENVLRLQLAATHSNDPYVDDYYHQACLARRSVDSKLRHHFCPTNLSDGPARARSSTEPHPFLQVDALGRVSFSSIRRPRPLLEVDSTSSSNTFGAESKFTEKPLEQEPMLAARVTVEDGICLLLDVDDIDRFLQFNQLHDAGVLLRQRRQVLLEGLASSLQLVDPLRKNAHTVDLAPKDDFMFLRLISLPKGRKLLLRYLQLLLPGELTRVVCMAIFRHLRFLFGNVITDPETLASTANLAIAVSSCVRDMELKSLAACLASVVCSVEHPPLRPIGNSAGDGATVVLKSVLDRATELLTDLQAAGNCSMQNRSFWQASFDAFFSLLTNYCFTKYDSVVQSVIQGSPDTPDAGSDVAKAISREMPVELLRASLPHTNEQQRKLLLEFTQRSMPVLGSSSQV